MNITIAFEGPGACLRPERSPDLVACEFNVNGRGQETFLRVGGGKPHRYRLKEEGYCLDIIGSQILDIVEGDFATQHQEVPFVLVVTTRELSHVLIYRNALQQGLCLLPPEAGPAFARAYKNQPPGEIMHIGMPPVQLPNGVPTIFTVHRGEGQRHQRHLGGTETINLGAFHNGEYVARAYPPRTLFLFGVPNFSL